MDWFALYDNQIIINEDNCMKKKTISYKEYATICLSCPYKKCHTDNNGCDRTKGYRVQDDKKEGEKDEEKKEY